MKLSAQRRFHTKKILHTETLKRRRFHIQKLVIIQMPFMHKRFSTFFLHADAFAEIFTHRALLCVNTRTFSQREIFPAQKLFTCRIVSVWFGMFFAHLVWEEFVRQEFFRSSGRSSEQENRDLLQCVRSSGASSARKKTNHHVTGRWVYLSRCVYKAMCGSLEVMGERRFCKVANTAWHIVFDNKANHGAETCGRPLCLAVVCAKSLSLSVSLYILHGLFDTFLA